MTHEEVKLMLDGTGLPVAYYQWPEGLAPSLPYLVYFYPNSSDLIADDSNYQAINSLIVELYTENKDLLSEAKVETALKANGLVYQRQESYIDSESMYEVAFTTSVLLKGE